MPQCKGCSRSFRRLTQNMCEPCRDLQKDKINSDPQCLWCGETFAFLKGTKCLSCSADDDALAEVDTAMRAPLNSKSPQVHLYQPVIPITQDSSVHKAELQRRSAEIVEHYKSSHSTAIDRAIDANRYRPTKAGFGGKYKMAPPKYNQTTRPIMTQVRSVRVNGKKMQGIQAFGLHCQYEDSLEDVVRQIRAALDTTFMDSPDFGYRITESFELQILFFESRTQIPPELRNGTIKDVWRYLSTMNGKNRFVTQKDFENRMFPIIVNVVKPLAESVSDFETSVPRSSRQKTTIAQRASASVSVGVKRKPSTDLQSGISVKRPLALLSDANPFDNSSYDDVNYYSDVVIEKVQTSYDGKRTYFVTPKGIQLQVEVQAKESGRGATKSMHKGFVNGEMRAFKDYHIETSKEIAYKNHRDEALRCATLSQCVSRFSIDALTSDINLPEIAVLVPDIIKVTHGPEAGKTWLCDKYVNGTFKKYSGTNEAGDGKDLFSKAVNAFAHYVAEQSEWSIVPTDIQGQLEDCISNGLVQSRKLFLYDIQFHTMDKKSGLGDHGPAGIKLFADQHRCNEICKRMNLKPTKTSIDKYIAQLEEAQEDVESEHMAGSASASLRFPIRRGYPKKNEDGEGWGIEVPPPGKIRSMMFFDSHERCGPYELHWGLVELDDDTYDFILLFDLPKSDMDWNALGCTGRDYWNFLELGRMETLRETLASFVELAENKGVQIHDLEVAKFVIEDIRDAEAPQKTTERVGWLSVDPDIPGSHGVPCNTSCPKLNIVTTKSIQEADSMGANLLDDTLAALSHYSVIRSDKLQVDQDFSYYFSPGDASNTVAKIIYFTSHSAKWNASLNDQGFKGIADFLIGHTCNSICKAMAFARRA